MLKSHRKLNTVLFPALLGLCVSAVQQALLWTKRGEQRYWLSLLKDDILKWAVKIKRNILVDFQTLIYYMTNILIYNQRKLFSNCTSLRCFESYYGVHYYSKHFEHIFDFLTPFSRPGGSNSPVRYHVVKYTNVYFTARNRLSFSVLWRSSLKGTSTSTKR